jgi:pantetheine-phosphate adenylyltransferase
VVIAMYPGRFDPVTNGHLDIVRRSAGMFDRVVVGVFDMHDSDVLFSTGDRVALFREAVRDMPGVTVEPFRGLTVAFARAQGATVLVRGIRAVTGFETEFDMALMNKKMAPEIESIYLMASLESLFISGTRIREVARLGYDVADLVPAHVADALREKIFGTARPGPRRS